MNVVIPWDGRPIFGFGSDEAGEAYVTTSSPTGQGVMRLVRDDDSPKTKTVPATKSRSRLSRDEHTVCIDSPHTGEGRQLFVIDIRGIA